MAALFDDQTVRHDVPDAGTNDNAHNCCGGAPQLEKLRKRLAKLRQFTPENTHPIEYANVQARITVTEKQILTLTPNAVAPLPGLLDILTSIVAELHRFFVMPDEDAQ